MSYQKHKSLDKNLIFAEYFNSEQEVRRNGGVPTGAVTIANGIMTTDDDNGSYVGINKINMPTINSVRWRGNFKNDADQAILGMVDEWGYVIRLIGGVFWYGGSSTTVSPDISDRDTELVFTRSGNDLIIYQDGIVLGTRSASWGNTNINCIGKVNTVSSPAENETIEIYNKALTAEEVTNLYNDARYVVPNLEHGEQLGESPLAYDGTFSVDGDLSGVTIYGANTWSVLNGIFTITYVDHSFGFNIGFKATKALTTNLTVGSRYRATMRARKNAGNQKIQLYDGTNYHDVGELSEEWQTLSFVFTAYSETGCVFAGGNLSATEQIYLDWYDFHEVTVEPTKEILNVNAFDGVARNRLSGDVTEDVLIGWDLTNWTTYNSPIVTSNRITGTTVAATGVYKHLCTIGSIYRLKIKGRTYRSNTAAFTIYNDFGSADPITVLNNGEFDKDVVFTAVDTEVYFSISGGNAAGDYIEIDEFSFWEVIPEPVVTAVEVVKEGQVRVPRFNGSSSKIDCGGYNDLTGDITVLAWVRVYDYDDAIAVDLAEIFSNDELLFELRENSGGITKGVLFSSDRSTVSVSASNVIDKQEFHLVAVTRTADGTTNIYIDGALSGAADQDSGTPVAGSFNMTVGKMPLQDRWFNGQIPEVKVIEGLLTPEEISQYFSSTKHLYNK